MDLDEAEQWINPSSGNEIPKGISSDHPSYSNFGSQPGPQKWEGSSIFDYNIGIEPSFLEFNQAPRNPNEGSKIAGPLRGALDWDPRAMLTNLSFLEEKIHQLQNLVHIIVGRNGQMLGQTDDLVAQQQQQLVTADVTSIIAQLISTAGSLLPSVGPASNNGQPCEVESEPPQRSSKTVAEEVNHRDFAAANRVAEQQNHFEEHEMKDEEDVEDGESLVPGSYEILQLEKEEILAPHTHFCAICGKGFKRDANLRMHMRGHGDEYKTPAALAKPHKESGSEPMVTKRYSCPYAGCKRNKEHKKFQPLKTILCVKNHYKRTHCDKSFTCSRCKTKKFSVIADLKTHEKHCGKDKWLCSCGTTFSRKDKLFGHISLFQGHTPAIPIDEGKSSVGLTDNAMGIEATNNGSLSSMNFGFGMSSDDTAAQNVVDVKESLDDPTAYFSPINFDSCNFGGFHEFPRPSYEDSENSFSFLLSESCNYSQKSSNI